MKIHVAKDLTDLIRLSGVYVKYCLFFAQDKDVDVNINMNLIEDA